MSTLTWLHLSDLHFRAAEQYNARIVLTGLLKDIGERLAQDRLRPDFIAITGDVAFSGKAAEYEMAQQFLDQLLKAVDLPKERLLIVPGNHDVDRALIRPAAKKVAETLSNRDEVNGILGSPDDAQLMLTRFKGYRSFAQAYGVLLPRPDDPSALHWAHEIDCAERKIGIVGLNSAWACGSDADDKNGVLIGERQARAAVEHSAAADIRIALLHHPLEVLREFERDDTAAILTDNCDFVLHGHLHKPTLTQLTSPDSQALLVAGGACYETRDYPNIYNFVELDFGNGVGRVVLRRYFPERGGYWDDGVGIYRNAKGGVWGFRLPDRLSSSTYKPTASRNHESVGFVEIVLGPKYQVTIQNSSGISVGDAAQAAEMHTTTSGKDLCRPPLTEGNSLSILSEPAYNLEVIRELLSSIPEADLVVWSFDHFREIYSRFEKGDTEISKASLLLDYCHQNGRLAELLNLVELNHSILHAEYAGRLYQPKAASQGREIV